jgi:hypothetical protein
VVPAPHRQILKRPKTYLFVEELSDPGAQALECGDSI